GLASGESVRIDNVTEERGVLVLSGPRSRELLSLLTDADLGHDASPGLRPREIDSAGHAVGALRVSYVGDLGWELHPPIESLPALYDALWEAGLQFAVTNYPMSAVNAILSEKGYKAM